MHFSRKFKRAWMRSNQRMHDMLLARPRTRYLQRWPDPALERPMPAPIPVAALRAKATRRTQELAKPRRTPTPPPPRSPGQVDPAMLQYQPSQRILELARPALKEKAVKKPTRKSSKGKRRLYSKERVIILAQRRITFKPPEEKKKPAKPLSYFLPRIKILCQPAERFMKQFELPPVPTHVKKLKVEEDKKYECPERIRQLAQPKDYTEFKLDEEYDPYHINPAALTYVATENIKKIAEPKRKEEKRIKK
ncbi:uncharacterized protein LOC128987763 [Macrosteles quadrilineatus]|uniref:uncharacterized protein LOC128987763 n=1 Tax=Macrosteles quadrilineatus TaxID=74068 RepID=UPI0023E1E27A|nr:uncharacterized protein LOC128987763 [Macrosteles quadrilineatus]